MLTVVLLKLLCLSLLTLAEESSFDLIQEPQSSSLVFSTLAGSLICVDRYSGHIKWRIQEEPAVKIPVLRQNHYVPFFLPDPKDGSLYVYGANNEPIKKLPFTIPHLVSSSPCRSSDGIMYTGKKSDSWFSINPNNGEKRKLFNFENGELSVCPREGPESVFIGRTEYSIIMVDPRKRENLWNVTFFDYSSYNMDENQQHSYDYVHLMSSSSGRLATINRLSGLLQWQLELDSPVIGLYLLQQRGFLSVPFTSIAESTLISLIEEINERKNSGLNLEFKPNELKLLPTLYVGENINGFYALPSLVDKNTITIELFRKGSFLLEGPSNALPDESSSHGANPGIIVLGHYKVPDYSQTRLQVVGNSTRVLEKSSVAVQTEEDVIKSLSWREIFADILDGNITLYNLRKFLWECRRVITTSIFKDEYSQLKAIMGVIVVFVVVLSWRLHRQIRDIQQLSQSSRSSEKSQNYYANQTGLIQESFECEPGVIKVGKIKLFSHQVLGKGCEGTFVFKGEFDERPVAVKRVLPECFNFADREVDLLRESDAHANVIRYFCTEQDKQFRYIALELCAATLQDYVLGKYKTEKILKIEILRQACQGLSHLHSLNIVHRDVKPHNVLLSLETSAGQVRAMISDFGLCKKLQTGRVSFSGKSGITGTEGWIAPEILNGQSRATYAVDIFSLGCVFYYVLTNGKHPFGDTLHRQANILTGCADLGGLQREDQLAKNLIDRMIAFNAVDRPPAGAVLKHPFFWHQPQTLAFFQEVSDRIEKESEESLVLKRLEEDCGVFLGDWRSHIDSEVAEDLRKYRNYRGDSVRDLLRALRNKKHHYWELSKEAQKSLGEIPMGFVNYWTSRFPLLLLHSWLSLQIVKRETVFKQYYDSVYNFPRLPTVGSGIKNLQQEGFIIKRPLENNWRTKQDLNWRRASEPFVVEVDLRNRHLYKSVWFVKWFDSNFTDEHAFIKWREEEFYSRLAFNKGDGVENFNPEFPTRGFCDKLRLEKKRLLEDEQANGGFLSKKVASPRRYYRKPKKTN